MEFFDPGAIEALVKQCEIISEVQLTKVALMLCFRITCEAKILPTWLLANANKFYKKFRTLFCV
jgi:hypothetical protein